MRTLLYVLFFLSGAAGLVYEIIWVRMLTVTFGASAVAVAAVLSSFMGGLALGSFFTGRLVDKRGNGIAIYGILEVFIGVFGLAFPLILGGVEWIYASAYGEAPTAGIHFLRFFLAVLVLVPPTFAMGGTLPAVVAALRSAGGDSSRSFSLAYGLNTIGATLGVLIAGFWMLWALGSNISLAGVASLNISVGIAALLLSRYFPRGAETQPAVAKSAGHSRMWPLFAVAFVTGAAALGAQVLWTRALSMVLGSAVYAFTAILAVILIAIGLGALVHRALPKRFAESNGLVLSLIAISGIGFAASVYLLDLAPAIFLWGFNRLGGTFGAVLALIFVVTFLVLFIPSFSSGMVLPALLARWREGKTGAKVGRLYAANTAGAIAGSLIATFLVIPVVGTVPGIRLIALAMLATGAILLSSKREAFVFVSVGLAIAAFAYFIPGVSHHRLNLGAAASPGYYFDAEGNLDLDNEYEELLFFEESVDSTFSVVGYDDILILKVNGKSVATTNYDDLRVEVALGYLPAAAFSKPRNGLVIGLGTGITLGALLDYPGMERVVCVEINPDIGEATEFFSAYNGSPVDDERVTLLHEDGRSFALCSDGKYDVITSDPIHPWTRGSSSLYTVEHFSNCAGMLNPGGVMAQWMPLYQLSVPDYSICVNSFAAAFENVALVFTGTDTVLLGSDGDFSDEILASPYLIGLNEDIRANFGEYGVNVEDKLRLEYSAPRSLYEFHQDEILAELVRVQDAPPGGDSDAVAKIMQAKRLALMMQLDDAARVAAEAYELGGNGWPNDDLVELNADIAFEQAWAAMERGDDKDAVAYFEKVLYYNPESEAARFNIKILRGY